MEEVIVYGEKNGPFDGQFVEVFFDEADNHIGVNWTNEARAEVTHFILKEGFTFDKVVDALENTLSVCVDIDDAHDMLEMFFDNDGTEYLDDYPEYVPEVRTKDEICEYMDEAFDRVWLVRKQDLFSNILMGRESIHVDVLDKCNQAIEKVCEKYGIDFREPVSDWEYGYWSGILAALRWVMGDEKDMLDT
jgi:hypothetical protein